MTSKNSLPLDSLYRFLHNKPSHDERQSYVAEKKKKGGKGNGGNSNAGASNGRFPFETIHGFKLIEVEYNIPPMDVRKEMRKAFGSEGGAREQFLKHIGEHCVDKLKAIGMSNEEIEYVKSGKTPNGYNTHHKLPIHGGGKNEFSNFVLMPIPPHDDLHHVVIDPQIKNMGSKKTIKLPWTDEMVFVPTNLLKDHDNSKDFEVCGRNKFIGKTFNKLSSAFGSQVTKSPSMDHDIPEVFQEYKQQKIIAALSKKGR